MLLAQNLPTALPFYEGRNRQFFRTHFCGGMDDHSAIECRMDRMLPFVLAHTPTDTPNYVYLVRRDGLMAAKIDGLLNIVTETVDSVGYILHPGQTDINTASTSIAQKEWDGSIWENAPVSTTTWADFVCDGGLYYLEISVGSSVYQSELLHIVDFPEFSAEVDNPLRTRVRFECANTCPVAGVPVTATPISQKLFLNARAAEPEYPFDKGVSVGGNGEEKVRWAKIKKRYSVQFYAVETVVDFCVTMPLYGTINFADQYGVQSAVTDVEVEVSWPAEGEGCLASVTVSFQRDFATYTGCC